MQGYCGVDGGQHWCCVVKESSRSKVVYTGVKAFLDLANGMGVRVKFVHSPRCSGRGEVVADLLSKGNVGNGGSWFGEADGEKYGKQTGAVPGFSA